MSRHLPRLFSSSLLLVAALAAGCNSGTVICTGEPGESCDDNPDAAVVDPTQVQSLVIDPADAVLTSADGAKTTQPFTVRGRLGDGTLTEPLKGLWSLSDASVGGIDASSGGFTASGEAGGAIRVRVEVARNGANPLQGDTGLTVQVRRVINGPGVPADPGSLFGGGTVDAAKAAGILYPLNNAVMPQNVYPANLQWQRSTPGDIFQIRLKKPNAEVIAYLIAGAGFTNSWQVEDKAWRAIAQSDGDTTATISVNRYEAATKQVYRGSDVSLRMVKAALLGSVYYWDIAAGRIIRIDDGTANRVNFMPTPPVGPVDNAQCIGCHAVSRDGRYMAGRLGGGDNPGTVFDLTQNLSTNPPPSLFPATTTSARWSFASFSPDNSRLITATFPGAIPPPTLLQLLDARTGAVVAPKAGALPVGTYPSWSPDGTRIAYAGEPDEWGSSLTSANLSILPVTGADSFGAPKILVPKDAGNPATGYPTWSPDSRWLAVFRGAKSRSEDGAGALHLVNAESGASTRLDKANGGAAGNNNFVPTFSPFNSGGYFWLMFLSRRDYGNVQAGTAGTGFQQLWVTAIKNGPKAGEDPSEVSYWLPGQDTKSRNISGYWAPKACRKDAEACNVGSECCGGLCVNNKCQPPPVDMCRTEGQTCGGGGCCAGLTCDRTNICSRILG